MPAYPHLAEDTIDFGETGTKMRAMHRVGVPYSTIELRSAAQSAQSQADEIVTELQETANVTIAANSKLVALIAYLKRLGNPPAPPAVVEATEETP